jgi:hypothetical protein
MLRTFLDNFVVIFINDSVIYSKKDGEHESHLRLVLETPRKNKFYVKLKKM